MLHILNGPGVTYTPHSYKQLKTGLELATKSVRIAFADVAIKETAIQSIRSIEKYNART
jgi:hypothetical protein